MQAQKEKPKENKNRIVANSIAQRKSNNTVLQLVKIDKVKPSKSDLKKKVDNNWVHFNIQMSGDSRMAIAGVGLAIKNEKRDNVYNGLLVSVPKDTEKTEGTEVDTVNKKLYGLIDTHGVKDRTEVYATSADNPHDSRKEALSDWKDLSPDKNNFKKYDLNVFQTGLIGSYINYYEKLPTDKSLKDSLVEDYGADGQETPLGQKLKALNSPGNAVMWFKGDPTESAAINSLQTAKTEHWMSAGMGNKVIAKLAVEKKVAIAGSITDVMKTALGDNVTGNNQFTTDKLIDAGYDRIGKQYGFFNQYSDKMTHFGGRSGHLEPIAAMGIKTLYFEEAGNGQAGRNVHIGKDSAMDKVVIDGVGSLGGVVSKALSWMKNDGTYWQGNRGPSDNQKVLMNNVIHQWLNLDSMVIVDDTSRKTFYEKFVTKTSGDNQHGQDKDKSMIDNSKHFLAELNSRNLTSLESGTLSDADTDKIVGKF